MWEASERASDIQYSTIVVNSKVWRLDNRSDLRLFKEVNGLFNLSDHDASIAAGVIV
jgi:hypothetical protein